MHKRGWIITKDGKTHPLPEPVLEMEEITWPLTMPEMVPGKPMTFLSPADFFRRHEIIEGTAYLYLPDSRLLSDVSLADIAELLSSSGSDRREFDVDGIQCRVWRDGTSSASLTGAVPWPKPAGIYFTRRGELRFLARNIMQGPTSEQLRQMSDDELRALWDEAQAGWPGHR